MSQLHVSACVIKKVNKRSSSMSQTNNVTDRHNKTKSITKEKNNSRLCTKHEFLCI